MLALHMACGAAVGTTIASSPRWNMKGSYHRYADDETAVGALVAFIFTMTLLLFIRRKIKKVLVSPQQSGKLMQKLFAAPTGRKLTKWALNIALLLFFLLPGIALLQTLDRLNIF